MASAFAGGGEKVLEIRRKAGEIKVKVLRVLAVGFTIFWMVLIFRFSADTGIESHELSDAVTRMFCEIVRRFTGRDLIMALTAHQYSVLELCFRKMAHMGIYCMLSFSTMLVLFTFPLGMIFRMLVSLIFCVIYACTDEFHQVLVAGRTPDFLDVLIDSAGAAAGIIGALLFFCIVYTVYHCHHDKRENRQRRREIAGRK